MCGWFGIVSGVRVPSGLSRTMEMCSRSRTMRNPRDSSARKTLRFGASIGNLGTRFGDEGVEDWGISLKGLGPECFQVEADCGLTVRQSSFIRVPFSDDNAFQAERVCDVPVRMLFHHDFPSLHGNQFTNQSIKTKGKV